MDRGTNGGTKENTFSRSKAITKIKLKEKTGIEGTLPLLFFAYL
jgi:hypothetical protein